MNIIHFNPADLQSMRQLMKQHGDSEFPYWGKNENGEPVSISIFPDRIAVVTEQSNG